MTPSQSWRLRRTPTLATAALLIGIALGGLLLGEYGSAGRRQGGGLGAAAAGLFDLLPDSVGRGLALAFLLGLLAMGVTLAAHAFLGPPALSLDDHGITRRTLLRTRQLPWAEVRRAIVLAPGGLLIVGATGNIALLDESFEAPAGAVVQAVLAALERHGIPAERPTSP